MKNIKEDITKLKPWLILITFAGLVYLVVNNFKEVIGVIGDLLGYLNVFFYGLIMAFLINIPMSFIEDLIIKHFKEGHFIRKHKRSLALLLAVIIVALFVTLMIMIIVPEIFGSIIRIIGNLSNYFAALINNIGTLLSYMNIDLNSLNQLDLETFLGHFGLSYANILQTATDLIVGTGTGTITQLIGIGGTFFNLIMGFFICLYLLGSKETFIRQGKKFVFAALPKDVAKEVLRLLSMTDDIFKQFVGGKFIEMIVVWIMMYVTLKIFNVSYVILLASMCALAIFIPYFGALAITVIAIVLLLSVKPLDAIVFFIIYQVVQNIDGNLIYPKIMGNATGLHAVWVLVSVFFFGGLFGAFGMLVAVPVTACLSIFVSEIVRDRLKKKELTISEDTKYSDV